MTDNDLYQSDNFINEQPAAEEQIEEDVKPVILPESAPSAQNDDPMEGKSLSLFLPNGQLVVPTGTSQERELNEKMNSDEGNVESPTTRDSFIFKCILCDRVLSASDEPKLLECLHNACSSCIRNKLYYENVSSSKGKILG